MTPISHDARRAQLTPWFPAGFKPARKGWYEVSDGGLHHRSRGRLVGRPFRYWDGSYWRVGAPGEKWAANCPPSIFGTHFAHQWRGLAKPATIVK